MTYCTCATRTFSNDRVMLQLNSTITLLCCLDLLHAISSGVLREAALAEQDARAIREARQQAYHRLQSEQQHDPQGSTSIGGSSAQLPVDGAANESSDLAAPPCRIVACGLLPRGSPPPPIDPLMLGSWPAWPEVIGCQTEAANTAAAHTVDLFSSDPTVVMCSRLLTRSVDSLLLTHLKSSSPPPPAQPLALPLPTHAASGPRPSFPTRHGIGGKGQAGDDARDEGGWEPGLWSGRLPYCGGTLQAGHQVWGLGVKGG